MKKPAIITVVDDKGEQWDMKIYDPENITAYLIRNDGIMFHYNQNLYNAVNISEQDFLKRIKRT